MALESITNFELGPCQAKFGTAGSEATLGFTLGGVEAEITTDSADLKADQLGSIAAGKVIVGRGGKVTLPLAEPTVENMLTNLPGARLVTDAMDATKQKLVVCQGVGANLATTTYAKSLLLIKYTAGIVSTSAQDKVRFPKAAPVTVVMLPFDLSNQRILKSEFFCFPDTTYTPAILAFIGDESAAS